MYEYMRALYYRFFEENQPELEEEIKNLHQDLVKRLDRPERKTLMCLLDSEDALRCEISVASFAAGFRLACGITAELSSRPYSFDKDDAQRAHKLTELIKGEE